MKSSTRTMIHIERRYSVFTYDEIYEELLFEFEHKLQRPLKEREEELIAFMAEHHLQDQSRDYS
ncbi:hypothetical protein [Halobacillus salinus]|uniref:Uncharacterized protein n=1 Tax=Halobacillus salinus TaxID=192814 RepID=A0A4Z0H0N1_9BACI|nr:hypothetical protein [Halobacillus salinus]TGB03973.1 hypothetical protein E4663_02905 [Halobacillus salinus]